MEQNTETRPICDEVCVAQRWMLTITDWEYTAVNRQQRNQAIEQDIYHFVSQLEIESKNLQEWADKIATRLIGPAWVLEYIGADLRELRSTLARVGQAAKITFALSGEGMTGSITLESDLSTLRVDAPWNLVHDWRVAYELRDTLEHVAVISVPPALICSMIEAGLAAPALATLVIQFYDTDPCRGPNERRLSAQAGSERRLKAPQLTQVHIVRPTDGKSGNDSDEGGCRIAKFVALSHGLRALLQRITTLQKPSVHVQGFSEAGEFARLDEILARVNLGSLAKEVEINGRKELLPRSVCGSQPPDDNCAPGPADQNLEEGGGAEQEDKDADKGANGGGNAVKMKRKLSRALAALSNIGESAFLEIVGRIASRSRDR